MTKFSDDQILAAAIAAEIAKWVVLQQWMSREDAAKAEEHIAELRERQLIIETKIEMVG